MAINTVIFPLEREARPDQAPVGLEQFITHHPGVIEAEIEPVGETVKVRFDPAQTSLEEITHLLATYGYPTGQPLTMKEER